MLERVEVSGFSLLQNTVINLQPGLTCISGESGAGKSLLFDAITFASGGRSHRSLLAAGTSACEVCLTIQLSKAEAAKFGLPWQAGLNTVRRRLNAAGRAQADVNSQPAKNSELQAVLGSLIEITGQFESATLFNPTGHLDLVDAFGGAALADLSAQYRSEFAAFRVLEGRLRVLLDAEQNVARELDFLHYQIAELDKAAVEQGEKAAVESQLRLLHNAEAVLRGAANAASLLTGSEEGLDAYGAAARAQRELQAISKLLRNSMEETAAAGGAVAQLAQDAVEFIDAALSQLQEAAQLCQSLAESAAFEPELAVQVAARLDELNRLEKKYAAQADELPQLLESLKQRLDVLTDATQSPDQLKLQLQLAEETLRASGLRLRKQRQRAAKEMQREAKAFFDKLEFPRCELQVELTPLDEPASQGLDEVELLISLNPGEPPRPLAQVASGGEASRLLLGLKAALAGKLGYRVMLLDEIEAGLGGRTAQRVADVLLELARDRQVLAITHLPVVAARAQQHMVVTKDVSSMRTRSSITLLDKAGQRNELARMLGGLGSAEELAVVDQLLAQSAALQ